jgi:uncharacterized protein YndB with AHSA1/START domain
MAKSSLLPPFGGNMKDPLIAQAHIEIHAPITKVWAALIDPAMIKHYMFGTTVVSDWHEGAPIVWKGEWEGKPYQDKGTILQLKPDHVLQYSHFSPLSGQEDLPENYHVVTIELSPAPSGTIVRLSQDNNATKEEREHSEQNWGTMLESLKRFLEQEH